MIRMRLEAVLMLATFGSSPRIFHCPAPASTTRQKVSQSGLLTGPSQTDPGHGGATDCL